ncbi:DnaJ C-terminal domain-containing protein [Allosalinactinospora lopnorensis]|uniref:DnaJ C-terminal domain-containing protein n=1 Tax=Allosalinactinospora lopnorensis TaxID=1352348 RepID=UPI000623F1DD|nr:J domain-containing protein [Allosalinactinospora lopnorensis]
MARDYYEVLGVDRNASAEEIQQAYRRLARRYHPDVNSDPSSEERFKEVNEAYQVLSDPQTRSRYDAFGPDFQRVPEDVDPGAYARAGGGAGQQRQWWSRGEAPPDFGDVGFDFEDLFGSLFGARRASGPLRGADQQAELELSVEEAYRGGIRHITLTGPQGPREYDVTIPAGVVEGQRIRLAGQGAQGVGGGPSGDLYITVRIAPHPLYRLVGRDIYVDLRVAPWEAALGATVPLTTPGGETKVRMAPGSSSGRRLRLRGEGLPNPKGAPGDLYAEVRIMVPPNLSNRERALFEELAAASNFDPRR